MPTIRILPERRLSSAACSCWEGSPPSLLFSSTPTSPSGLEGGGLEAVTLTLKGGPSLGASRAGRLTGWQSPLVGLGRGRGTPRSQSEGGSGWEA